MVSIPVKLLMESQGHIVSIELTSGVSYRGKLFSAEESMNIQLQDVIITQKDGESTKSDRVFVRGSQIAFVSLPEVLKDAPVFNPDPSRAPAPVRVVRRR